MFLVCCGGFGGSLFMPAATSSDGRRPCVLVGGFRFGAELVGLVVSSGGSSFSVQVLYRLVHDLLVVLVSDLFGLRF